MTIRSRIAHYLRVTARYLEKPSTLALRRYYFMPQMYEALDQPWVRALNIATVIDIGANVGDFAFSTHPLFPNAQFYSFEPLPDCYDQMLRHLKHLPRHQALNLALGDESGELTFQRSSHGPSSSFLKMSDTHKSAFPSSADSMPVKVKVERLDTVMQGLTITEPLLVKIDVQGYEAHVLRGGAQTIHRAAMVIVETSFKTLYEGQPLFTDVQRTLSEWGFSYAGALDQLTNPHTGTPLQQDSLFIRII
jgi:FkbM family methyltransferase